MNVKEVLLVCLLCLVASFTGVHLKMIYVKAGEIVALHCSIRLRNPEETKLTWTSHTPQETNLSNMSSAEQSQMGILIHERSLVILSAGLNYQGNYSCSLGNTSIRSWFRLTVYTTLSKDYKKETQFPIICYTQESCTLTCPDRNIPAKNTPNITSNGIVWQKEGEVKTLSKDHYVFSRVDDRDGGVYTCSRSYLYQGQTYNKTFAVPLNVKPKESVKSAVILSPLDNEVFYVDLGSRQMINCTAVLYSDIDEEVFWLSENSKMDQNKNSRVFFNNKEEIKTEEIRMTAFLVFQTVLEEDLLKNYSCKLESTSVSSSMVTITLARKAHRSYVALAVSIVVIVATMAVTVTVYIKYKIPLTLFMRDTLGCHRSISDGKSYDAYLMFYKSDTNAGLNTRDRKMLENVLEDRFGYSLCLNDRDVLPGQAVAQAVLDCIEQSRTVVLVPTSPDPGLQSSLLSAIHEALVERQTRLVLIKTEATEDVNSGSLAEILQLLSEVGHCVTWKGMDSAAPSSSFWKQLRYYLPAAQRPPKIHLLPQTI